MRRWLAVLVVPWLLGAEWHPPREVEQTRRVRLTREITAGAGSVIFTAWADDEVIAGKDASDGQVVTYHRRYVWLDRCTWDAAETLTPRDATHYTYAYREAPLACPEGAQASVGVESPLDGVVTVHPMTGERPLTPLVAWARGWEPGAR
jgi:hypothetical protein